MYRPLQIPYLLSKGFLERIKFTEYIVPELSDYLICMWESESYADATGSIHEVTIVDGCISLVVDKTNKYIGYAGLSKTDFNMEVIMPDRHIGFRFKPGAFYALTGLEATVAINTFLSIEMVDANFDKLSFFKLSDEAMKKFLIDYFIRLSEKAKSMSYIHLFEEISAKNFSDAESLYNFIGFSPSQAQRIFKKHYGLTPKKILSIIRFQHCLAELLQESPEKMSLLNSYYDQSHFISDFKRNIGLTPIEFINLKNQRRDEFFLS